MNDEDELSKIASRFLRKHGDAMPPEPSKEKFKLGGSRIRRSVHHVPVASFLKEYPPIKHPGPNPCQVCGGPISKFTYSGRCRACYSANARDAFIGRAMEVAETAEADRVMRMEHGWEGIDHMRTRVPIVRQPEDERPATAVASAKLATAFADALKTEDPGERLRAILTAAGAQDRIPVYKPPPKYVPIGSLEEIIVKPGIEKYLIPLLHFKGRADLGSVHRKWNMLLSMHAHEVEGIGAGLAMQHNPLAAHLCEPPRRVQHLSFQGFLSRLLLKPQVADLHPGILDYARSLQGRPFLLREVSEEATRQRHAWWRTFEPKMPAWRAKQAAQKAERDAAKAREKLARAEDRRAAREARLALIQRQRDEMRTERAARAAESARKVAAEKERRRQEALSAQNMFYPYLVHAPDRPDHDLLRLINAAVPGYLDPDLRADMCQDLAVGILCGDFAKDDLGLPVREVIKRVRKMFPQKYGPLSLDAVIPGTDRMTLIDTIASDAEHW